MEEKKEIKKAVALKYDTAHDAAPQVVAKGRGVVAEKIIKLAEKNQIPLHKDSSLASILGELELLQEIPQDLYPVVAEVFAFIYNLDKKRKK